MSSITKFCNQEFESNRLYEIIDFFYPIGVDSIKEIYDFFHTAFDLEFDQLKKINHSTVHRNISEMEKLKQNFLIAKNAAYLGIDFPTWMNFDPVSNKKKIMIVGIDPLRSEDDRKYKIEIGTPYGFHIKLLREKHTKHYWDFIESLSDEYAIYMTDTFKVFYYKDEKKDSLRSYKDQSFTNSHNSSDEKYKDKDIHQSIFNKEVEFIQPDLIVTLGHLPRMWFSLEKKAITFTEIKQRIESKNSPTFSYGNIPILPMPHLSGRSINHAKTFVDAGTIRDVSKNVFAGYVKKYLENVK
jgi:hypothetical protein